MSVELNHTIIPTKDKWVSAKILADILNLEAGPEWGHFVPIKTANGVTLDFDTREEFRPGHYAFLVSNTEFAAAFARIRAQAVRYYADPRRAKPGDQSPARWSRRLFRRPQRSRDGNNHPPLRRPARADLIVRAPATVRCTGAIPARGGWHVDVVDAERREGIEDRLDYGRWRGDTAGLARTLDAEGLTVVGWSASVTSAGTA
jgi:hypothetical protein